jgi:hypothetical protein
MQSCSRTGKSLFIRYMIGAVLLSGLVVAIVGLVERVTWNGKILWTIVPYQWSEDFLAPVSRARGPFVNPDHFANYLAMILPLATAVSIWPRTISEASSTFGVRIFASITALIVFAGLFMSMSRAALIGTLSGFMFMALLIARYASTDLRGHSFLARHRMLALVGGAALALLLVMPLVGTSAMGEAAYRFAHLVDTTYGRDGRVPLWRDAVSMARDFPVTGVGLGCFGQLFARFQRPPWSPVFWDTANNDALQSAIELGLPGLLLILWCGAAIFGQLVRSLGVLPPRRLLLICAIVAAIVATTVHEFVDFPLQIPANAILLIVLSGIGLRIADNSHGEVRTTSLTRSRLIACAILPGAAGMTIAAGVQSGVPFPFEVQSPSTPQEARTLIVKYPGRSRTHLMLLERFGSSLSPTQRILELQRTLWLEPTNPLARDLYAFALIESGNSSSGLAQMARSAFLSPALGQHWYLNQSLISSLTEGESAAITQGRGSSSRRRGCFVRILPASKGAACRNCGFVCKGGHGRNRSGTASRSAARCG